MLTCSCIKVASQVSCVKQRNAASLNPQRCSSARSIPAALLHRLPVGQRRLHGSVQPPSGKPGLIFLLLAGPDGLTSVRIGENSRRVFLPGPVVSRPYSVCSLWVWLVLCQMHFFPLCDTHVGPTAAKHPARIPAATPSSLIWVSLPVTDPIATLFIYLKKSV